MPQKRLLIIPVSSSINLIRRISTEAAKNFQTIFENPNAADVEVIFKKAYIDGSATGQQGHCTDLWFLLSKPK